MMDLAEILHFTSCSLVVEKNGEITTYNKKGVRDLIWLLDNKPERLHNARIADKVVGRAAAGLMIVGGVREVYAAAMGRNALLLLEEAGIRAACGTLVEYIADPGNDRCPLEKIVADASSAKEIEILLRKHFEEMKQQQ